MFYLILFGIILTLGGAGVSGLFVYCLVNKATIADVWFLLVGGIGGLIFGIVLFIVASVVKKRKGKAKTNDKPQEEPKPKEPTFYEKNIEAAQAGDAQAQINIGNCYYSGKGVAKDHAEAVRWYKLAADQGNALAINYVGKCYELGRGVEKNIKQAIVYYKQAATMHEPNALCNLAQCHLEGNGTTKNYKRARELVTEVADMGFARGQCMLGMMYAEGKGVEKSEDLAIEWLQKSVDQGSLEAMFQLGKLHFNVSPDYSMKHLNAQKEAVKLWEEAAEKGHKEAQYRLGLHYQACRLYNYQKKAINLLTNAKANGYGCDIELNSAKAYVKDTEERWAREEAEEERKRRAEEAKKKAKEEAERRRYLESLFPSTKPSNSSSTSSSSSMISSSQSAPASQSKVDPDADTLYYVETKISVHYYNPHQGFMGLTVYDADADATFYYESKSGRTASRSTCVRFSNVEYNSVLVSDVEYRCPDYTGKY